MTFRGFWGASGFFRCRRREIQVPADMINLGFVLGNKVMVGTVNAKGECFEAGVDDLCRAEPEHPGRSSELLTHPVQGLDNHAEMIRLLTEESRAIKVFMNVEET